MLEEDTPRAALDGAAPSWTDGLVELGELAQNPTIERAIDGVRELLGMEVAYATRFTEGQQFFERLRGDGESFGISEGMSMPLEETYCERVLSGRLPNLIPDVRAEERAASLAVTEAANVGAFVSVPLLFSDGRLYGTLCAGSHDAKPTLGYRDLRFMHVFARIVADQLERQSFEEATQELEKTAHELELQAAAASALVTAVEARDAYTADHSRAVVDLAVKVARKLELKDPHLTDVKHVALLHDIGKIAIPDAILRKPSPLNREEWDVMRRHPVWSERMICDIPELRHLAPVVRAEHERWDGKGYPDGIEGDEIPVASRIVFACDAYHAMTSDRPYRDALSHETARSELAAGSGTQFCPEVVAALLAVLEED